MRPRSTKSRLTTHGSRPQRAGNSKVSPPSAARTFAADFYDRFYLDPRTRVTSREEMERRAQAVGLLVSQLQIDVKRILDAGCGLGWMRKPLLRVFPGATYVGLEVSEHLCQRHGWICSSLAEYAPRGRFDLIICYDVMQYLSDIEAARGMRNLGRLCRGALYFHAPTREDWRGNADTTCSDGDIHLRDARWYRERLRPNFEHAGHGVHVRRGVELMQWELERPIG